MSDIEMSYYAPAEGAPHSRTWMCWPSTAEIYGGPGSYYESVQETIGRLAATIARHEPVTMLAGEEHHHLAAQLCGPDVTLLDVPTDDMWARDCGPVFLRSEKDGVAALDFNFNGWGNKERHGKDTRVPAAIAEELKCPYVQSKLTGEGGGLEYDGDGTLILAESCWVNENRNPGWTRTEIEAELKRNLGVQTVIWVPGVRGRDITDGHIDGSLRFVRPGLLIMGEYEKDGSEWDLADKEALQILSHAKDAKGRSFEIVSIPSAVEFRSRRPDFFSGYANFYLAGQALFTPTFGDSKWDAHALQSFQHLFPERQVISLNVDRIYENGGGIHCVTQQQPLA